MTYKNLLNKFINGVRLLEFAIGAIDCQLNQAQEYIKKLCLHFQSLWDLQPENLYNKLSQNLPAWIACLNEVVKCFLYVFLTLKVPFTSIWLKFFNFVIIFVIKIESKK